MADLKRSARMRVVASFIILMLTACTSAIRWGVADRDVIGEFCHSSIDAALCLNLRADHTYTETFSGGGSVILGPDGIAKSRPERRGSGDWRLEANRLLLSPLEGKKRLLIIKDAGDSIKLTEALGKNSREYRR